MKRVLGSCNSYEMDENLLPTRDIQPKKIRNDCGDLMLPRLRNVCEEILQMSSLLPLDVRQISADGSYFGGFRGKSTFYVIVTACFTDDAEVLYDLLSIVQAVRSEVLPLPHEVCGHDSCNFCAKIMNHLNEICIKVREDLGLGPLFAACFCRWVQYHGIPSDDEIKVLVRWASMISWQQVQECESKEDLLHLIFSNIQQYMESRRYEDVKIFLQKSVKQQSLDSSGLQILIWSKSQTSVERNVNMYVKDRASHKHSQHVQWMKLQLHWIDSATHVLQQGMKYLIRGTSDSSIDSAEDANESSALSERLDEWLSDLYGCKANSKFLENELLPEIFLQQLLEIFAESDTLPSDEIVKSGHDIWGWQWLGLQDIALKQPHPWLAMPQNIGSKVVHNESHNSKCTEIIKQHYDLLTNRYGNDVQNIHFKLEEAKLQLDFICTVLKIFIYIQELHCVFFEDGVETSLEKIICELQGDQSSSLQEFASQLIAKTTGKLPRSLVMNGTVDQLIYEAILSIIIVRSGLFEKEMIDVEKLLFKFDLCSYAEALEILHQPTKGILNVIWRARKPFLLISLKGDCQSSNLMQKLPDSINAHIVQYLV